MGMQLRPTPHQIADLRQIVELGAERLDDVQARLSAHAPPTLSPQGLIDVVGDVVDEKYAEPLVRQLLSLQGLVRQSGQSAGEVLEALGAAIAIKGDESGIGLAGWKPVEGCLKSLVEHESIRIAATALDLSYDYANLLQRSKILTEVRPIFNKPADRIEGAVICFTMRLRYSSADGEHDLSIALDEDDVKNLCEQCERATAKAATTRSLMVDSCKLPVVVSGEKGDA
jgi:hypothetical protein